jgi:hypothetical protein
MTLTRKGLTRSQPDPRSGKIERYARPAPVGRSGPHQGSKPGALHISDMRADPVERARRAQDWGARTGRPIPPAYRPRKPLRPVARLSAAQRTERYMRPYAASLPAYRPYVQLSAAQCRRIAHKAGMSAEQRMQLRDVST